MDRWREDPMPEIRWREITQILAGNAISTKEILSFASRTTETGSFIPLRQPASSYLHRDPDADGLSDISTHD